MSIPLDTVRVNAKYFRLIPMVQSTFFFSGASSFKVRKPTGNQNENILSSSLEGLYGIGYNLAIIRCRECGALKQSVQFIYTDYNLSSS